jgi:cytochrome d ubiquinol oxidase subunit II
MDLNIIWFILLGVLIAGYAILDGFDLGVGMLHLGAKGDDNRRIMLNAIGPVWDGNEVWLLTAGGALFAAFPDVYATVFSGFYTAFMLFLAVLIFRAVSIEFRSKVESPSWRKIWDGTFSVCSYMIALLLGVTLANIVTGVPVGIDKEFAGSFFGLLQPYAIVFGISSVLMMRMHGTIYMTMKTDGDFQKYFVKKVNRILILFIGSYVVLHSWTIIVFPNLIDNYTANPILFIFPALIILSALMIPGFVKRAKYFRAFVMSSSIILFSIAMVAAGIFPNLLLSNPDAANSLTIYNAASSQATLSNMLIIAIIGVPIVLGYTIFVYRIFKGKVELDETSY